MEFVHVELKRDTWLESKKKIKCPEDAVNEIRRLIENMDREMLVLLNLATNGSVINASVCSIGSINQSIVSVAQIYRTAILSGAASIILLHNHPSGDPSASKEDLEVTQRVSIAGALMNINLLDHIIIGADGRYCSLNEEHKECFQAKQEYFETILVAEGE